MDLNPIGFIVIACGLLFLGVLINVTYSSQQTAIATCERIIDKSDLKLDEVRHGDILNMMTKYHVYDICTAKDNGTVVRNVSLGYMTEGEVFFKGLAQK
jgi:hypothetical protein